MQHYENKFTVCTWIFISFHFITAIKIDARKAMMKFVPEKQQQQQQSHLNCELFTFAANFTFLDQKEYHAIG